MKTSSKAKVGAKKKKGSTAPKKLSTATTKKKPSTTEASQSFSKSTTTQKEKKAAARAVIRETRAAAAKNAEQQKLRLAPSDDDASDLDYGDDDNDDSDEDYDEKPWAMKKATTEPTKVSTKVPTSRMETDDTEEDEESLDRPDTRTFVEAEYADYKIVTIPRRRLIRWCHEPYFEKAVQDFYVRITIGRDPVSQKPLYKLSKIDKVEVKELAEYEFPAEPGKPPVRHNHLFRFVFAFNNVS